MARGIKKLSTSGGDWGRKPYVSGDYNSMTNIPTNAAVWRSRIEKHSEFEKPYLKDHNYAEMQHLHPKGLRPFYRGPRPDADPLGAADPCAGTYTVHATLDGQEAPFHYVECGTVHRVGMFGGVGSILVVGIAGSFSGGISGDIYTAPPCGLCDETTDHIAVSDSCGRVSNLIIKTRPVEGAGGMFDIAGPDAPSDGDCYTVVGGAGLVAWSISKGSIDVAGCVTVTGECGMATVTASDACGNSLTRSVRMPDGVWTQENTWTCSVGVECHDCTSQIINNIKYELSYGVCNDADCDTSECRSECTPNLPSWAKVLCSGQGPLDSCCEPACGAVCVSYKTATTYTWECP